MKKGRDLTCSYFGSSAARIVQKVVFPSENSNLKHYKQMVSVIDAKNEIKSKPLDASRGEEEAAGTKKDTRKLAMRLEEAASL